MSKRKPKDAVAERVGQEPDTVQAAMADALRVLRNHCGALDEGQRERLDAIIDKAESEEDYYTVLYTLMLLEINLRDARERLALCLHDTRFIDKRDNEGNIVRSKND